VNVVPLDTKRIRLVYGESKDVLSKVRDDYFDALVTDPPAGIGFMGKDWDSFQSDRTLFVDTLRPVFVECLRTLKTGRYGLVWALPRTSHWTALALEDAGFEICDVLTHLFAQGYPKHKSKLKPGSEHWILVRKWAPKATLLNIDDCRIPRGDLPAGRVRHGGGVKSEKVQQLDPGKRNVVRVAGGWPANISLECACEGDEHDFDCPVRLLDDQSGILTSGKVTKTYSPIVQESVALGPRRRDLNPSKVFGDSGGASRFYYCSKASKSERGDFNLHPTVKPLKLMKQWIKLITPPDGIVFDPFMGSGTTGVAALQLGYRFIGIEQRLGHFKIAERRVSEAFASFLDNAPQVG
jgi:DNA modification methylase